MDTEQTSNQIEYNAVEQTEELKHCPYCGHDFPARLTRCNSCGELVEDEVVEEDEEETQSGIRIPMWAKIILTVILLAFALFCLSTFEKRLAKPIVLTVGGGGFYLLWGRV